MALVSRRFYFKTKNAVNKLRGHFLVWIFDHSLGFDLFSCSPKQLLDKLIILILDSLELITNALLV